MEQAAVEPLAAESAAVGLAAMQPPEVERS